MPIYIHLSNLPACQLAMHVHRYWLVESEGIFGPGGFSYQFGGENSSKDYASTLTFQPIRRPQRMVISTNPDHIISAFTRRQDLCDLCRSSSIGSWLVVSFLIITVPIATLAWCIFYYDQFCPSIATVLLLQEPLEISSHSFITQYVLFAVLVEKCLLTASWSGRHKAYRVVSSSHIIGCDCQWLTEPLGKRSYI